jgi:hypothetical protein
MSDLTRRDAVLALAAAAAGVAAARPASADDRIDAAARAARAVAHAGVRPPADARAAEAHVLLVRSWERTAYLYVDDGFRGFVALDDAGFAIAAACQASGRRVAVQAWGSEPDWAGVGRFNGARLALDVRDFDPARIPT